MLTLGRLELGRVPRIAVPLSDVELRASAADARALASIFELRIDGFARRDPDAVAAVCREARAQDVALLATVRAAEEGGHAALDDHTRLALFERAAPLVDGLDIEFHATIRDQVVALGRRHAKRVIISHHDFERAPADRDLTAIIDGAAAAGADIVKLAVAARDIADVDRLLGLLRTRSAPPLIIIALGPHGTLSRVFFPLLRPLITYGYLRAPNAPGQLSLAELAEEMRRYCPEF